MCHTWKASHILSESIKHTVRWIWVQPTIGPSVSWACVQREWDLCYYGWSSSAIPRAPPSQYLSLSICGNSFCVFTSFSLFKHPRHCCLCLVTITKNTMDPQLYLHPALSCGVTVKARYEQNSQTRGIMPRNVCLVISWLLQTGRGDVNVINLARLTQRARSGI